MDGEFPINDIGLLCRRQSPRTKLLAKANHKSPRDKFAAGPPWNLAVGFEGHDWTDEEEDFFYLAILECERERRASMGILGRWPLYEIGEWARLNPEHAEKALGFAVLAAGITVGVLWHVLSPSLPSFWF